MRDIKDEYKNQFHSILLRAGVEHRFLTGRHTPCLFCGGRDRARWIADKEILWCNVCQPKHGIDALMQYIGMSFKETCQYIRGDTKMEYKTSTVKRIDPLPRLKQIHKGLKQVKRGDVVARYLKSRGINKWGDDIFTHTNIPYYGGYVDGKKVEGVFNAMVSRVTDMHDQLETYHITYLTEDAKKIDFAPAKIIVTPKTTITGNSVKLKKAGKHLCVAEGIETALMVMQEEGIPCWSALNANGMAKMEVPASVEMVSIFIDNDESFTGQSAGYQLARRLKGKGVQVNAICDWEKGEDYLDYINRNVVKDKSVA